MQRLLPVLTPLLSLVGLYIFTTSFFLARHSLPHISSCSDHSASELLQRYLGLTREDTAKLRNDGILSTNAMDGQHIGRRGCWTDRKVDAIALIVVDALRFDFALEHLPKSIGRRLNETALNDSGSHGSKRSKLFKFVADPPTVTMQRLKGLTTGGLPAFADISRSFGGATIDEDSWVHQMKISPPGKRGLMGGRRSLMAFVGDDTWVDLFPSQFDDSHPFPSFNTRDLDTVDNGCLEHLPRILNYFGPRDGAKYMPSFNHTSRGTSRETQGEKEVKGSRYAEHMTDSDYFELVVVHFLGVDHVGHTYGPNNVHMAEKLAQIDAALSEVLNRIDSAVQSCEVAFIFGDHGMTKDGNHGGGTDDETNAALFAHFSPGCANLPVSVTHILEECLLPIP